MYYYYFFIFTLHRFGRPNTSWKNMSYRSILYSQFKFIFSAEWRWVTSSPFYREKKIGTPPWWVLEVISCRVDCWLSSRVCVCVCCNAVWHWCGTMSQRRIVIFLSHFRFLSVPFCIKLYLYIFFLLGSWFVCSAQSVMRLSMEIADRIGCITFQWLRALNDFFLFECVERTKYRLANKTLNWCDQK